MDGRTACLGRTIENGGDETSGEPGLFIKVQIIWDLRSVGVVGPHPRLRVEHGLDVCEEVSRWRTGSKLGGEFRDGEKIFEFDGKGVPGDYKSQLNGVVPDDHRCEFPHEAVERATERVTTGNRGYVATSMGNPAFA